MPEEETGQEQSKYEELFSGEAFEDDLDLSTDLDDLPL